MLITDTIRTTLLPEGSVVYRILLPTNVKGIIYFLHGFGEESEDILKKSNLEVFIVYSV